MAIRINDPWARRRHSALAVLKSTVSYPVMNLSLNIDRVNAMKATKEYRKAQKQAAHQRVMAIVYGKPYLPTFG